MKSVTHEVWQQEEINTTLILRRSDENEPLSNLHVNFFLIYVESN